MTASAGSAASGLGAALAAAADASVEAAALASADAAAAVDGDGWVPVTTRGTRPDEQRQQRCQGDGSLRSHGSVAPLCWIDVARSMTDGTDGASRSRRGPPPSVLAGSIPAMRGFRDGDRAPGTGIGARARAVGRSPGTSCSRGELRRRAQSGRARASIGSRKGAPAWLTPPPSTTRSTS